MEQEYRIGGAGSVSIKERLFTEAGHRRAVVTLLRACMEGIRDHFLPYHFKNEAYSRYPDVFQKRRLKYDRWKRKVVGHTKPNVFSGTLQYNALVRSRATATSVNGGKLYIRHGDHGVYMTGERKGLFYDRGLPEERDAELTVVSGEELQELADWFAETYVELQDHPEYRGSLLKRFRK